MTVFLSSPPFLKHLVSFTSAEAFLDALKICPTTFVAEVMFSGVNILTLAVKIWVSLEIVEKFVVTLSICKKETTSLVLHL